MKPAKHSEQTSVMPTKRRSTSSRRHPASRFDSLASARAARGRVSGMNITPSTMAVTAIAVTAQNTPRQPVSAMMPLPISGAQTGDTLATRPACIESMSSRSRSIASSASGRSPSRSARAGTRTWGWQDIVLLAEELYEPRRPSRRAIGTSGSRARQHQARAAHHVDAVLDTGRPCWLPCASGRDRGGVDDREPARSVTRHVLKEPMRVPATSRIRTWLLTGIERLRSQCARTSLADLGAKRQRARCSPAARL